MSIEVSFPVLMRGNITFDVEPGEVVTSAQAEEALMAINRLWEDHPPATPVSTLFADILGPEGNHWAGEIYDREKGETEKIDLGPAAYSIPRVVPPFTVTIPFTLSPRRVADMLIGAFEGGSSSWVQGAYASNWSCPEGHRTPWYDDETFVASPEFAFEIEYDDPEGEEGAFTATKVITQVEIVAGLEKMAKESTGAFSNILNETDDAEDADVFLQYVVLGEIVYG